MEFNTAPTDAVPKNLYPCLATITIVPHGTDTRSRRLSAASFGSNEDNGLSRVISGGRRKTSFGVVADRGDRADEARRKSFSAQPPLNGSAIASNDETSGKWYWRVQAGTTDNQLVLLPLTSPANPLLTSKPQPLSHAMPAHSSAVEHRGHGETGHEEHEGIGAKIKNLFRKGSTTNEEKHQVTGEPGTDLNDSTSQATATTATAVDRVIDQTPQGEMLPSAGANAIGATNVNANAETGWPGVINGQHLASIVVDLHSIDKNKVTLGGGKKNEGSYVTVHVSPLPTSLDSVGKNHHEQPKSGVIKFEFDKDWIGAKGEAELLHHYIVSALDNVPSHADRGFPQAANFQLGGGTTDGHANVPSAHAHANAALGREIAPDQRVVG